MINLDKAADFGLATSSLAGTLSNLLQTKAKDWDLAEASYNGVRFLILAKPTSDVTASLSNVRDTGGRRAVRISFPYRDGQTTDDLGRAAESFDVEAILVGNDYKTQMGFLINELQKPKPGVLIHPVRGEIVCKMLNYTLTHSAEQRKAVGISITFIEHNFSITRFDTSLELPTKNYKQYITAALAYFEYFNKAIGKVKAIVGLINTVKNAVVDVYNAYNAAFRDTLVKTNSVFNSGSTIDIPSLMPVNQGGVIKPDGTLATNFPASVAANDPFYNVPVQQIQAALTQLSSINSSLQQSLAASLGAIQVQNLINSSRVIAEILIQTLKAIQLGASVLEPLGSESDGATIFAAEILDIKRSVLVLQKAYEIGVQQNSALIKRYTVPRLMSIREAVFFNGLDVERSLEVSLLNPEIASTNYISAGTVLLMPTT